MKLGSKYSLVLGYESFDFATVACRNQLELVWDSLYIVFVML
jgi:hypothetical protein